jgi:hypothetical protein
MTVSIFQSSGEPRRSPASEASADMFIAARWLVKSSTPSAAIVSGAGREGASSLIVIETCTVCALTVCSAATATGSTDDFTLDTAQELSASASARALRTSIRAVRIRITSGAYVRAPRSQYAPSPSVRGGRNASVSREEEGGSRHPPASGPAP